MHDNGRLMVLYSEQAYVKRAFKAIKRARDEYKTTNKERDTTNQPVNMKVKVCLLGDGAVGKTSLIRRFVNNMFTEDYLLTIGTRTSKKRIVVKKPELQRDFYITLMIWDIMGQISFRKLLHPTYLKGARGALLVCDMTREETLEHLDDWIDSLFVEGQVMPSVFVANKNDLSEHHTFSVNDLDRAASAYDSPYFVTSAKTGINVEDAFNALGEKIIKDLVTNDPSFISGDKPRHSES
jgi:small GTP-binding protein